jgi:uncharacterized protein DUF3311
VADQSMAPDESPFGRGATGVGRTRPHEVNKQWYWLLLVPLLGVLITPIYNSEDPTLIGIPFFYWYQMVWIPISVFCTLVVYRKTRGER